MILPQFDEIYVISDLHMGGIGDYQILRETGRLEKFINWVGQQRPAGRVALVLNGDVIDTLAEESGGYIAVDNAEAIIARIMTDSSFKGVWQALANFVQNEGRNLIIVLGNHDLELAFPVVQRAIYERLAGNDLASRARIEFSCMGAGYSCLVGGSRVFCSHGNEVDSWNYIQYENLAKVARRLNAGRTINPCEWQPNAGTMMVKDIMNDVKRRYHWIDLLKPEMKAAVGILLALDPDQLSKIKRLLPIIGKKVEGSREVDQRLAADGFQLPASSDFHFGSVDSLLGSNLMAGLSGRDKNRSTADAMLLAVEKNYKTGSVITDPHDDTLGTGQYIWDRLTAWFSGIKKEEALRRALQDWLKDDPTFLISDRDETCQKMLDTVGAAVDFIVTGHTHLERAIDLGNGRFYFNCGTWIRLLALTKEMLKDEESFKKVYKLLLNGSMAAIDDPKAYNDAPFVLDRSSAVCIKASGDKVSGQLVHITSDGEATLPIVEFTR